MNIRPLLCGALSAVLIITTTPASAGMIGSDQILVQEAQATQRAQVQAFIARDDVRKQMELLGVNPALATERVASLTDSELQQLSQNIGNMPAGGSAVGLVLVVLLILILLELLGAINIFPTI